MFKPEQLETITRHYLAACQWADCPENTNPRVTKSAENVARVFCEDYIIKCGRLFEQAMACADYGWYNGKRDALAAFGHDVYLTSVGHGVGFWDRDALQENDLGQKLTDVFKGMKTPYAEFYKGWVYLIR